MLTFSLQCLNTLLLLASALLCLRAGRIASSNPYHRAAWRLTGAGFVVHGLDLVVQNVFGGVAMAAGEHSAAMEAYLQWMPAMNHSRTFLLDGIMLGLLLLAVYRPEPDPRFWRAAAALLVAGFLAGAALGASEGRFTEAGHYSAVAVWDVAEMLLLMATLFALLLTSRADRALWGLLSTYGISLALGAFSFALLTQIGIANSWHPTAWSVQGQRIVFHLMMLGFAAWRVTAARRGKTVPAMLERSVRPVTTMG
ncbi:hypothetical protein SAMN05216486_1205 [bacterium JGI 053]|nr:hypothetical protein SAMN05216486_1205 [bacterium JGI 053]